MEYHRLLDRHLPDSYAFSAVFDWKLTGPDEKQGYPAVESNPSLPQTGRHTDLPVHPPALTVRGRRPAAIVVDNVPKAFPQAGLAQAGIVFQAPVEGHRAIGGSRVENLVIRNLIVIETHVESIPDDDRGRLRIRACGDGPGFIWRGDSPIGVTWRKPAPDQPMRFFDERDEEVVLRPGLTWIYVMGPGGELRVR